MVFHLHLRISVEHSRHFCFEFVVTASMICPPNTALEPTPTALEFVDALSYTTIIELAQPLSRRRGSALDRSAWFP